MTSFVSLVLLLGATAPAPAASCEVVGADAAPADVARARAACETARARFAELFGAPVPGVRVILQDRAGYRTGTQGARAAVVWPTSEAMTARVEGGAAAERHVAMQWREVLPHEIAHTLLAARFFPEETGEGAGDPEGAVYGTPLPDWLDEGVAIWAEPLESRRRRLAQARALPEARRDLRAILTSTHPGAGNAAALAVRDGAAVPPDEALRDFYPQSIAVLAFLYDRGGREAVRDLVRRIAAGATLPAAVAGLPGLPARFEDVAAAWEEWLAGATSDAPRPTSSEMM
ncbi:MAG TPA: hypothetical protein VF188_03190 [Longimicrobiales bacterium]